LLNPYIFIINSFVSSIQLFIFQKWKTCQGALFKTGKEHMMRRVSQFDINSASPEILKKIQTILKPFTLAQIRDVSKGAATFFVWVSTSANSE